MLRIPVFEVGQLVMDREDDSEIGTVETVRRDGLINVRWKSGRTEWVHECTVILARGITPKRRGPDASG
jgi:hypothetical protein